MIGYLLAIGACLACPAALAANALAQSHGTRRRTGLAAIPQPVQLLLVAAIAAAVIHHATVLKGA
jgi:hypothetical protein